MFRPSHSYSRPRKFIPTAAPVVADTSLAVKQRRYQHETKQRFIPKAPVILTDREAGIIYQSPRHHQADLIWRLPKRHYIGPNANPSLLYRLKPKLWTGEEWRQVSKRFIPGFAAQADTSLIYAKRPHQVVLGEWLRTPRRVLPTGTAAPPNQSLIWKDYKPRNTVLEILQLLENEKDFHYKPKHEPNIFTVAPPATPLALAFRSKQYRDEDFYQYWRQTLYVPIPHLFADQWILFTFPDEGNFNANSIIQPLWKIYFFLAGTATESAVSALGNGSLLHCNPVMVDRFGNVPAIYTNSEVSYDISIRNEFGVERHFIEGY